MKNVEILDKDFNRLCWMTNEPEKGLHFYGDKLSTTIDSGVYTLEFRVPKRISDGTHNKKMAYLKENNYLRFRNRQNVPVLMSIKHIVDNRNEKSVYAEDVSISLINSIVDGTETPAEPQAIEYYLTPVLEKTGFFIGNNESTETKILELSGYQNALERVRHIIHSFEMEFYFRVEFTDLRNPKFYIHIVQERREGEPGFRISSDDVVRGIERTVNTDNIITKLIVRGRAQKTESDSASGTSGAISQSNATQYDSSKSGGATAVITSGWVESEVNQFRMNALDPPYVNGAYIDKFLRNFYSDSPLIGQGALIKEMSDYFGISVGAFMGVIAKESTFGRGEPGKSNHNYGCIRWTAGSGFPAVHYAGSAWNDYPNARTGIAAWFKLVRHFYVETGQSNYRDFLNKYSPTSDGNVHATFKNLMWGVLKSFGYDMSAGATKTNYSKSTDNVLNFEVPSSTETPTEEEQPENSYVEAVIAEAMRIRAMRLPYRWGGNGLSGFDCSGFVSWCFRTANYPGYPTTGRPTTNSMWDRGGIHTGHFTRISRAEVRRGDIVFWDTGYTYPGDANHVGIALDNQQTIHTGNPNGIIQSIDSMKWVGAVRVKGG